MAVRTGPQQRDKGAGFTLIELLLAVALVVLLLGALVFNFSGLQRGVSLDEGANQLEALFRFARAHAASTGKQVQITFDEDVGEDFVVPLGTLRVSFERDPVERPGLFEPLFEAAEYVRGITDLVSIQRMRWVEGDTFESEPTGSLPPPMEINEPDEIFGALPSIRFFPDGSSDSAELILASRSADDPRRIALRLQGITGSIRRQVIADGLKTGEPESSPQPADAVRTADANRPP